MCDLTVYLVNYNNAEYLEDAIASLCHQTYKFSEVICFDDGSEDGSGEILSSFAAKFGWDFIGTENRGLVNIASHAMSISQGRFILRLDSDDMLEPNALQLLIDEQCRSNADIVYGNFTEVDARGKLLRDVKSHSGEEFTPDFPAHGACTLINRAKVIEYGGYTEGIDCQDGVDIWLLALTKKFNISHVRENIFSYRVHGLNLTRNRKRLFESRRKIFARHAKRLVEEFPSISLVFPIRGAEISSAKDEFLKRIHCAVELFESVGITINQKVVITSAHDELISDALFNGFEVLSRPHLLESYNSAVQDSVSLHKEYFSDETLCVFTDTVDNYTLNTLPLALHLSEITTCRILVPAIPIQKTVYTRSKSGGQTLLSSNTRRQGGDLYEGVGGFYIQKFGNIGTPGICFVEGFDEH